VIELIANATNEQRNALSTDLDKIMKGNPRIVGEAAAFDWAYLDKTLIGSASRNMHAVWRVICHFPYVSQPLKVPQYLIDAGVQIATYEGTQKSPNFGDPLLLEAFEQFITYAAKRYDGDKRLGWIQAGLLGKWGEWHAASGLLPKEAKDKVLSWYIASWTKTQVQVRYAEKAAYDAGFGRHDDFFTIETLDGEANGGVAGSWYYWPSTVKSGQADYWKRGAMGGETGGNQNTIFEPGFPARTRNQQDFMECVNVTHTTWMFHHAVWNDNNRQGMTGVELANARFAHARMGYNFHVPSVSVSVSSTNGQVDVDVTLTQIGVAPYYYDLGLGLSCPDMSKKILSGPENLIDQGASMIFSFTGVPATESCLYALALTLESSYAYSGRPIKFAQGNGALMVRLPLPGRDLPPAAPVVVVPQPQATVVAPKASPVSPPKASPSAVAPKASSSVVAPQASPMAVGSSPIVVAPRAAPTIVSPLASPVAAASPMAGLTSPVAAASPTAGMAAPVAVAWPTAGLAAPTATSVEPPSDVTLAAPVVASSPTSAPVQPPAARAPTEAVETSTRPRCRLGCRLKRIFKRSKA
jgi:hypothetical protein